MNNASSGGEWLLIGCAIVLAIGLFDAAIKWARKNNRRGPIAMTPDSGKNAPQVRF